MIRLKKSIAILLICAMILPLAACGEEEVTPQKQYGDDIENTENTLDYGDDDTTSTTTPTYDKNNAEKCLCKPNLQNYAITSYYHDLLSDRLINSYDELLDAYSKFNSTIILSKKITPEELFKIMTIINLDEPKYFQVASNYSYTLDASGYVNQITLNYTMSQATYRQTLVKLENIASQIYSEEYYASLENEENVSNCYDIEQKIYKNIISAFLDAFPAAYENGKTIPTNEKESLPGAVFDDYINSFSVSKMFNFLCRYIGIESTVKIGVLTNYDAQKILQKSQTPYISSSSDYSKVTTQTGEGIVTYTVDYDFTDYYMWNMIKFNDNWYNVDFLYSAYISFDELKSKNKGNLDTSYYSKFKTSEKDATLVNVSDYMISTSRMSYYTDDILGTGPASTNNQYLISYRNGDYLVPHTESQMLSFLNNRIIKLRNSKEKEIYYQFEDEDSLNYFINNLSDTIDQLNETTNNLITSYKTYINRQNLTIRIYDITYKK